MSWVEEYDIVLCRSCVEFLVNGESEDESFDPDALERHWPSEAGWRLLWDDYEFHFSTLDCDTCGETLAGGRVTGKAWRPVYSDLEKLASAGLEGT